MSENQPSSREYPVRPIVGAGTIIVRGKEALMIKRAAEPNKGFWSIPGGMVEAGETCEHAAARECLEEVNLKINSDDLKFVDVVNKIVPDEQGRLKFHVVIVDFSTEKFEGEVKAQDDAIEALWVKFEDIPKLKMANTLRILFEKVGIGNWDEIITEDMRTDYR